MRPVTVSCVIDSPRERVFAYLADVANYPEFADHLLKDLRLERLDSRGVGASVSFRVRSFPTPMWGDVALTEVEPPHRIAAEGRTGRIGRVAIRALWTLTPHDHGMTKVSLTFSTEPVMVADRLQESLGTRGWAKRRARRALKRLRQVLEQSRPPRQAVRPAAG